MIAIETKTIRGSAFSLDTLTKVSIFYKTWKVFSNSLKVCDYYYYISDIYILTKAIVEFKYYT